MWIARLRAPGELRALEVENYVARADSPFQKIEILDSTRFGRLLVLDGIPQSSTADEHIYHETLVHSAMMLPAPPRSALIIGGGEGACLREVLRYRSIERVVMVEIDKLVIELCQRYLPEMSSGAFEDDRVEIVHANGRDYLESTSERFDRIILDLSDPIPKGPASRMFTKEAFEQASEHLTEGGALAIQAEPAALGTHSAHCAIIHTLRAVFPSVLPIYTFIPLYGTLYGFAIASKDAIDANLLIQSADGHSKLEECNTLKYWDTETSMGAAAIPRYLREAFAATSFVGTDARPIEVSISDLRIIQ